MWNLIFLIALIQFVQVSTRTIEPLEGTLWFDRLNDIIRLSKIEEFRDVERDESYLPFYRNLLESDVSINEKRTILSSHKSSSEKRALSMFARWGPINTVGKDRNPIRSGYPPNSLDSIRCRKKCFSIVSEINRLEMFTKFLDFSTKNEQDAYLQSLISIMPVKNRRPRKQEGARLNQSTFLYSTSCSSGRFSICKKAFISIHGITPDRLRRLCLLLRDGKIPQDMRGQNRPGNAIPGATVEAIKEHIASFPVKQTHYTSREYHYLSEQLNVKIMHNMFKNNHPEYASVKYDFYLKVFHEAFSLTFGRPKVDTCCQCESLQLKINSKSLNDTTKRVAVAEKMVHLRRARKFYTKLEEVTKLVKTDDTALGICIDYMQNLQLPSIPIQEAFYLRQLVVNVFCVHNLKDNSATFYVYNEGTASKGPNEVCSFLIHYLNNIPESVKHLHLFSDGCLAQNKNNTMVRMLMALVSLEKFKTINQFFPIRGHSFLPCDRDFSVVKRGLKKFDHTYTLEEYTKRISECPRKQKFLVNVPKTDDILDFKQWWPKYYKKNCLSAESQGRGTHKDHKVSFKINDFMHFTYSSNTPNKVNAKNFIDGISTHTFLLQTSKEKRIPLPEVNAYTGPLPINKKKMDNLKKLRQYLTDDPDVQNFWDKIYTLPTKENDD